MAYKDPDKQREANRQAKRKQRVRDNEPQGMTKGMTNEDNVIPKTDIRVIPERTSQGNIKVSKPGDTDYEPQCETTRAFVENRPKNTRFPTHKRGKDKPYQMTVMERLFYRPANKLGRGETNFVSLPGRACYGVV